MARTVLSKPVLENIARRFKALAEPSRLEILAELRGGERTVTELMDATDLGQANVSKHLRLLHQEGFVLRRKEGLNVVYRLADDEVFVMCDLMCGRLERAARDLGGLLTPQRARSTRRRQA